MERNKPDPMWNDDPDERSLTLKDLAKIMLGAFAILLVVAALSWVFTDTNLHYGDIPHTSAATFR
jgi:hypothetical protein